MPLEAQQHPTDCMLPGHIDEQWRQVPAQVPPQLVTYCPLGQARAQAEHEPSSTPPHPTAYCPSRHKAEHWLQVPTERFPQP